MSIPDDLMMKYYELLTDLSLTDLNAVRERIVTEPKKVKMMLAKQITSQYHGTEAGDAAEAGFEKLFGKSGDGLPDDIEELELSVGDEGIPLMKLLTTADMAPSGGEARRLLKQGGIKIDQQKVDDAQLLLKAGTEFVLQAGKRKFKKIILKS